MESLIDESVGREINLQIERGGTPLTVKLKVGDLHSITPNHFLEVSGAVIHPLSYQQARHFGFKCGLVYVAEPGYMLSRASVPRYSIIKKFARKDIADLGDFIVVISELSRGERVPLEYVTYTARHRNKCTIVTIYQHGWYATPQLYTRNDATGLWIAKSAMLLESPYVVSIHQRGHRDVNSNVDENIAVEGTVSSSRDLDDIKGVSRHSSSMEGSDLARTISGKTSLAEQVIKPALVKFEVRVPPICMIDGVHAKHFIGAGVVIHHSDSLGRIAVDRNTVAVSISDIMVSFAAYPIEIPGEVIFLHPFHNFALVAYDPSTLGVGASVIRASKLLT
uniref:PDZ-like domain-containing protein n=1 Tax=Triticum urartu TaxID=4572 RepID=A0A8R7URG6_TRIUA